MDSQFHPLRPVRVRIMPAPPGYRREKPPPVSARNLFLPDAFRPGHRRE